MMLKTQVYTVSELVRSVRLLLEECFPVVRVTGEISNFSVPSSGHWYFTLKDNGAQLRAAMFKPQQLGSRFIPKNGDYVTASGRLSLYEGRGDFQLIAEHLEEQGMGKLQLQFEALKQRLQQEGLFDIAHKKKLPLFVQQLGVITSATGAAIRDVLTVLKRRCPAMRVIIYPTLVQGENAALGIVKAIHLANQRQECDALLLTRGGGSLEDLWPFNEEIVARAIFESELPVVTGIGHEIDTTIADFVADQRAPTPSAAAELLSINTEELLSSLQQQHSRLVRYWHYQLTHCKQHINFLTRRLKQCHPQEKCLQLKQTLDHHEQRLNLAMNAVLVKQRRHWEHLAHALNTLSPLNTLSRGYAIIYHNQHIVTDSAVLQAGAEIKAQFAQGSVKAVVCETE